MIEHELLESSRVPEDILKDLLLQCLVSTSLLELIHDGFDFIRVGLRLTQRT